MSQAQQIGVQIKFVPNENKKGCHQVLSFTGAGSKDVQTAEPVSSQDFCQQMKEYVDGIFDPTTAMSDEDRNHFIQEIQRKIHSGEKLTADEMQYLRIHDPQTYAVMARVQAQREALKTRMQSCRSKQEAQEVYMQAVSHISKEDPAAEALYAAFNKAREEVMQSSEYQELPETEEEAKKMRQKASGAAAGENDKK